MPKHVITNAAEITTLEVIDHTWKTGGGPVSVGGTVIIASKGPVGVITQVTAADWEDVFGMPLPKKQKGMEGLRHLADAVKDCNYVNVVRCVSADAKFPVISYLYNVDKGAWAASTAYIPGDVVNITGAKLRCILAHTSTATAPTTTTLGEEWEVYTGDIENNAHAYGTTVALGDLDLFNIRPIDGDASTNRRVRIAKVLEDKQRFTIQIVDKDSLGDDYVLEQYEVGLRPEDTDDMGMPAYIESVFENMSDRFRVDWNDEINWTEALDCLKDLAATEADDKFVAFVGGTSGSFPTVQERKTAWELLRNEKYVVNLMFAAGEYDSDVLTTIADIVDYRHCSAFIDAPPYMQHDDAIDWLTGLSGVGIKSRHVRCYYSPYKASDQWYGGKTVWGASGAAAAAKAKGNANYTGVIPGIHFSPAGTKRGYLDRTGISPLFPNDLVNRDNLYDARINPVVYSNVGGAYIDDDLTLHYERNYSRFGWVNDILDYIESRWIEAASYAKHEPDGLTRNILWDLTKAILDDLVTSGALVPPRDPAAGRNPYILTVTQKEIDLWYVQWDVCPTGSARRIVGQPKLIR